MAYEHRLKVRYGETDQMGVVHHANYLLYLEEARTEYLARLGCPYGGIEERGIGLPVRRVDLRYRAPARYGDELVVRVSVAGVRAASVTFAYELTQGGAHGEERGPLAMGTVELACVELSGERRPRVLPDDLRELMEGALEGPGGP